ncbi:MAG: hypothetical protein Q8S13_09265 [Dehalococcoidia bacterium]|nr:hypothetical protein [Dehalococcoidia bacterium]
MRFGGWVGIQWFGPWAYVEPIPWRVWVYSVEHDDEAWFWRVFGLEISVAKRV